MSVELVFVVAMDKNRAIGKDGALPWSLPDDLQHFKRLTLGKPMLMGRKTYTSIGRALPGRRNIVLTRDESFTAPGIEVVHSLEEALRGLDGEVVVIGGGEIFALTLGRAARLELTFVNTVVENADAFFPEWNTSQWLEVKRVHHEADDRHAFSFDFVTLEQRV
ncbi:MAG: dihydrofolate reductase [Pleurocapsa sp. SU_196_0]|nr:dihydrofolate reductase [Pleurocapsa sp. SU_196_0]